MLMVKEQMKRMLYFMKDKVMMYYLILLTTFAIVLQGSAGDIIICQNQDAVLKWPGTPTSTDDLEYQLWYYGTKPVARWTKTDGFVEISPSDGRLMYKGVSDIIIQKTHHTDSGTYNLFWKIKSAVNSSTATVNLQVIVPPSSLCLPNITHEGGSLFATLPEEGCGIPRLTPDWKNGIQKSISGNISVLNFESGLVPGLYTACANGKSTHCLEGNIPKLCSDYTIPALQLQNESGSSSGVVIAISIAIPVLLVFVGILVWWKWEYFKRKLFSGTNTRGTAEETEIGTALMDHTATESTLKHKAKIKSLDKDTKLQENLPMQQKQKHEPRSNHTGKNDEQERIQNYEITTNVISSPSHKLTSQDNLQQPLQALGIPPVDGQQHKLDCSKKMGAIFPQFQAVANRLKTFADWPVENHMKPEDLAEAGFFYEGVEDRVRCFFCGLPLGEWASGDDAWAEHEKHSASCEHVTSEKMAGSSPRFSDEIELTSSENPQQPQQALGIPAVDGQQCKLEIQDIQSRDETVKKDQCDWSKRDEEPLIRRGQLQCITCRNQIALVLFSPCLHTTACSECARKLTKCNFCEETIRAIILPFAKQ